MSVDTALTINWQLHVVGSLNPPPRNPAGSKSPAEGEPPPRNRAGSKSPAEGDHKNTHEREELDKNPIDDLKAGGQS